VSAKTRAGSMRRFWFIYIRTLFIYGNDGHEIRYYMLQPKNYIFANI
jgi:hypothetical protein